MKHVLFSAWPDHQTPESAGPLLHLVAEVEQSPDTAAHTRPMVVHCRYAAPRPPAMAAPEPGSPPFHWVSPGKGSEKSKAGQAQVLLGKECLGRPASAVSYSLHAEPGLDQRGNGCQEAPSLLGQEIIPVPAAGEFIYSFNSVY